MAKKKILMVCEAFGGGVFTYVSQLCNDMVDDFDVYLAYSLRPQTPKNYKDFLDQRVHLIEMQNVGVKGLTNLKSDIAAIKELRQIEKDVQPDVIHLHSSVAGGLGRLAYNGKNNTVVYTPHGYAHILMGPGKKRKVYKFAEKVLGNRALTLTCCESEDEEAKKFSKRTAYVETGVNLADLSASLDGIKPVKNDKFTVFTLGRACVQKQPQLFNRIAELVPDARFIWIGNGELENELTAPNIEVTGWKPRKEALAMAKGADAFILCSLGEAIAMSLIENMYIKKLILVSNTMGNKSVINDGINGYVCDKAEEYAEHIKAAMKEFPKELPERAYQDVLEIYNTDAMKKKYIEFYNDVVADNCGQMCDEFAKNDVRIKVIHKINGGLSQARNAGMSIMTGDYITFVDSDDILEHEFIEEMLRIINKYNAQVAICKNSTFEKGGTLNNGHVGISERSFDAVEAIKNMLYQKDFDVAAWGKMYIKKYENALNERGV